MALKISLVNEAAAGAAMPMVADAKKRRPANGRPRCRATALPAAAITQVRKRRAAMTRTNRDSLRACDGWSLRLKVNVDPTQPGLLRIYKITPSDNTGHRTRHGTGAHRH